MLLDSIKNSFLPVYYHFLTIINLSLTSKNSFFAKQCSLFVMGVHFRHSFLWSKKNHSRMLTSRYRISKTLSENLIQIKLMVTICTVSMLKLCDKSICKPLNIIFKSCLMQDIFPLEWKKANVAPIHKTKVLEGIIYNTMFTYFIQNKLISENQSRFKPCDSCVNQLLATAH